MADRDQEDAGNGSSDNIAANAMKAAEAAARDRKKDRRASPMLWALILIAALVLYTLLFV